MAHSVCVIDSAVVGLHGYASPRGIATRPQSGGLVAVPSVVVFVVVVVVVGRSSSGEEEAGARVRRSLSCGALSLTLCTYMAHGGVALFFCAPQQVGGDNCIASLGMLAVPNTAC